MRMRFSSVLGVLATSAVLIPAVASAQEGDGGRFNGPYVGLTAGYSNGKDTTTGAPLRTATGSPFFGAFSGSQVDSSTSARVKGGEVGLTGGYNVQRRHLVYGLEGDATWSDADGDRTIANTPVAGTNERFTGDVNAYGTLRARVGYAWNNVLVYGTAGGAAVQSKVGRDYVNAAGTRLSDDDTRTHIGGAYGGGVEWAVNDKWSVKGEYLRLDVEKQPYNTSYADGSTATTRVDVDRDVGRVGVNYRF
jgi:outer membrane immunogenic protein